MATTNEVQALYIAYFGRPADAEGLKYWTASSTTSLETIADGFAETPEYKASTEGESLAQIINDFYVNLFGRNAEIDGLNYWVNEVAIGNTTTQQVGLVIGQAAVNASPANSDTVAIESKFTAANQWTTASGATTEGIIAYSGSDGVEAGINYLKPVLTTETVPSVESTESSVNSLVTSSGTGGTLDLTVFTDVADSTGYTKISGTNVIAETSFKLNAQNQTINATNTTLNATDVLADSSTSDSDTLNLNIGAAAAAAATGATFQNIENINVAVSSFNTGGDLIGDTILAITGAKAIDVDGTVDAGAAIFLNAAPSGATSVDTTGLTQSAGANTTNQITVGGGGVTVNAGALNDTIILGNGADVVNAGAGANQINNAGANATADSITQDAAAAGALGVALNGTGAVTITATTGSVAVTNGGTGARTVDASASTVTTNIITGASGDTVTTGSAGDFIATAGGADTITTNAGADTITGGTGADTMSGGAGADTFNQADTDSAAATSFANSAGVAYVGSSVFTATDVITFGNGLDIISDFQAGAGGDTLAGVSAGGADAFTGAASGLSVTSSSIGTAQTAYVLSGSYDSGTQAFTIAADGNGPDTLLAYNLTAGDRLDLGTSWTLLDNTSTTAAVLLANNLG